MDQVKFVEEDHITPNFLKAVFHNFTWSIIEYFDSYYKRNLTPIPKLSKNYELKPQLKTNLVVL